MRAVSRRATPVELWDMKSYSKAEVVCLERLMRAGKLHSPSTNQGSVRQEFHEPQIQHLVLCSKWRLLYAELYNLIHSV